MKINGSAHILIVGPSLKMGGIERASSNIANGMIEMGYKTSYLAIFPQEKYFMLHPDVKFIEPTFNKKKIELFKLLLWLRKTITEIKPDVVLVFNIFYGAIVRLALYAKRIPVFISDRASPLFNWPKHVQLFNCLVYKTFPPQGLIVQTKAAAKEKRKYLRKDTKVKVIPNALREVQLFPEIKRQKKILAVGRLNDHLKGFDRLVEAFSKIENKEWKLVFAGGDAEGKKLKRQASSLGIEDRVSFLGKVKDIDKIYAEAGLFVIPSRSEGFPNALCEAMAAGLPCISFDFIAGPQELIEDNINGMLVTDGDIDGLAEKIDYLISSPEERNRIGQNALRIQDKLKRKRIAENYKIFILGINGCV